jgi:hypothetical protein
LKVFEVLDVGDPARRSTRIVREAHGIAVGVEQLLDQLGETIGNSPMIASGEGHLYSPPHYRSAHAGRRLGG